MRCPRGTAYGHLTINGNPLSTRHSLSWWPKRGTRSRIHARIPCSSSRTSPTPYRVAKDHFGSRSTVDTKIFKKIVTMSGSGHAFGCPMFGAASSAAVCTCGFFDLQAAVSLHSPSGCTSRIVLKQAVSDMLLVRHSTDFVSDDAAGYLRWSWGCYGWSMDLLIGHVFWQIPKSATPIICPLICFS